MVPAQQALAPAIQLTIDMARLDHTLADQVMKQSGTHFKVCYQCRACANGCPFVQAMDYTPNQVLRLVQFGLREQALTCKTIWVVRGLPHLLQPMPHGD